MWIISAACFWMAATTLGWECPVEQTAMPAQKSRKAFPSGSSTIAPLARSATMGYSRASEGEMYLASYSITALAFGPGRDVLIRGNLVSAAVIINSSKFSGSLGVNRNYSGRESRGGLRMERCHNLLRMSYLINAVETGTETGRAKFAGHARPHRDSVMFQKVEVLHLRFQRTLPSFVSSKIIPRLRSSFRMRSDSAKSFFLR